MKSKIKTFANYIKRAFKNGFKMLSTNKLRLFLFSFGGILCISIFTFVSLYMNGAIKDIELNQNNYPQNALILKGNIEKKELISLTRNKEIYCNCFNYANCYELNENISIREIGTAKEFLNGMIVEADECGVFNTSLIYGRSFNEDEINGFESAAIITESSSLTLFGTKKGVNKVISVGLKQKKFKIVGIIKDSYHSANSYEEFADKNTSSRRIQIGLYTPYSNTNIQDSDLYNLVVLYSNNSLRNIGESVLSSYLVNSSFDIDSFFVREENFTNRIDNIKESFAPVLICLSVCEVLTISIFYFFLLKERVKEIGIRKAIGANNSDITLQFLIENFITSLFISLLGCLFGTFGFLIVSFLNNLTKSFILTFFSFSIVFTIFMASFSLMIIFSFIPGIICSRIKVSNALRFE